MSRNCKAELCVNWTGQGCICDVLDIEPDAAVSIGGEGMAKVTICSHCTKPAILTVQAEEAQDEEMHGCAKHFAGVALTVVDMYSEDGVICIYRANEV